MASNRCGRRAGCVELRRFCVEPLKLAPGDRAILGCFAFRGLPLSDRGDTLNGFATGADFSARGGSHLSRVLREHWRLLAVTFALAFAVNAAWYALSRLSMIATVVWPLNALTVVIVLRWTRGAAASAAVIAAETAAVVASNLIFRGVAPAWALFPLAGAAEILFVVMAARRLGVIALGGARLEQAAIFALVAGALAPAVSACLATLVDVAFAGHRAAAALVFIFWWSCNSLGMITILPLGLGIGPASLERLRSARLRWEAAAAACAVVVSAGLIFHVQGTVWTLLIAPSLVFATFRFGIPGAAVANLLAALVAIASTSAGSGPLAKISMASAIELAGLLQVFLALCWFVTLPPACLLESFAAELRTREDRLVESQMLAADAQNRMLRYQLDPHFFFNTLTALSSLIQERESEKADLMVVALSAFLRHSLQQSPTDRVALADEVGAQERYLQIEQIRFGARLAWTSKVSPQAARVPVPVFILQPLFENAIKHAVAVTTEAVRVELAATAQRGVLTISVSDDGPGDVAAHGRLGVGLDNVRRRLALIYGASASLAAARRKPRGFVATIRIPIEEAAL